MKEYKDHNGDPFYIDDEFFPDHEAYLHMSSLKRNGKALVR